MTFLRRLRGAASTALLWAASWGIVGAAAYAVLGVRWTLRMGRPLSIGELIPHVLIGALFLALYGMLAGAAFAGVFVLVERRRLQDLTIRRIAAWGALGGISILLVNAALVYLVEGLVMSDTLPVLIVMALLGAGSSAGSLALARRAAKSDRQESPLQVLSSKSPLLNARSIETTRVGEHPAHAPVLRTQSEDSAAQQRERS